jgi:hypothetical protein
MPEERYMGRSESVFICWYAGDYSAPGRRAILKPLKVPPLGWVKLRLDTASFSVREALSPDARTSVAASSSVDQGLEGMRHLADNPVKVRHIESIPESEIVTDE